ncbi:hypothetical protein WISP_94768 [Willisornis vidua]|uniref:Secreted protein n=1 Tax=Willisornis vidua TaxID=1566151 RepID=A0ABQ9D6C9_9PASS|nr:hypothetical protein WISP_94768 [Willisornis vidua]
MCCRGGKLFFSTPAPAAGYCWGFLLNRCFSPRHGCSPGSYIWGSSLCSSLTTACTVTACLPRLGQLPRREKFAAAFQDMWQFPTFSFLSSFGTRDTEFIWELTLLPAGL